MTRHPQREHEVVVVGGRCAGAATALLLARAGHDVAVVERTATLHDVVSTHSIARGGVVQLSRWGLLDGVLADGAPAVRQVTFASGGQRTTGQVKDRAGVDLLVAPRRDRLDALLLDAARDAGATVRTGVSARGVHRDRSGRVTGVHARHDDGSMLDLSARYVVGADGLWSRTARWVGARTQEAYRGETSTLYAYVDGVPWTGHEFHIADDAFAGVFVTHGGQGAVWLCRPADRMRTLRATPDGRAAALLGELAEVAPDLAGQVHGAAEISRVRGTVRLPNHVRQAAGPGWALVGDAGYHRDPLTGHGITDAFRDAELLAAALDAGLADPSAEADALAWYGTTRDSALRETLDLTLALAAFPAPDAFVELQKQLSGALEREAEAFAAYPDPPRAVEPAA
jgi:2-polyprenyl-6-methoxyphenol hydroxylase-like FAD-dependent oxidoreductase